MAENEAPSWSADGSYRILGRGGLYPHGCALTTATASGALQRYRALKLACDWAEIRSSDGRRLSGQQIMELARSEGAGRG